MGRLIRLAKIGDKMHRKLVAGGIPEAIAAFVSDDVNRFPHSSRKFLAKALMDGYSEFKKLYGSQIEYDTRYGEGEDKWFQAFLDELRGDLMSIRDWLAMGREPDGSSINMHLHQTLRDMKEAAAEWHERLAKESEGKGHPALYTADDAEHVVRQFEDGFRIVEVPADDLINEGNLMGHCVGTGDTYKRKVREGDARILSLRDPLGWPHVTVEMGLGPDGMTVRQIQARADKPPKDKYKTYLRAFFESSAGVEIGRRDQLMLRPTSELIAELNQTDDPEILDLLDDEEKAPYYLHKIEQAVSDGDSPYEALWSQYEDQGIPSRVQGFAVAHPEIEICRQYVVRTLYSEYGEDLLVTMTRKYWDGSGDIFDFLPHEEAMQLVRKMLARTDSEWVKGRIFAGIPEEIRLSPAFRDTFLQYAGWHEAKDVYDLLQDAEKMDVEDIIKILRHKALTESPKHDPAHAGVSWALMNLRRKDPEKFLAVIDGLPDLANEILKDEPVFNHRRQGPYYDPNQPIMNLEERTEGQKQRDLEQTCCREDRILKRRIDENYVRYRREENRPQSQLSLSYASTELDEMGMHRFSDRLDSLMFGR